MGVDLIPISGFLHMISWKKMPGYREINQKLASLIEGVINQTSVLPQFLISCYGLFPITPLGSLYIYHEPRSTFRTDRLISILLNDLSKIDNKLFSWSVNRSITSSCFFDKSVELFYRPGRQPACAGGVHGLLMSLKV